MNKALHVGIPFKDGGRNPAEGLDCWGLVHVYFLLERGIFLEDYRISAFDSGRIDSQIKASGKGDWEKLLISELRESDVVTFRLDRDFPELTTHCGVYLGNGKFMHCMEKTGVVISRIDDIFFKARFSGGFRWTGVLD